MKYLKISGFLSIYILLFISCKGQSVTYTGIMFYNVENLFDTIDNPDTEDNEYLPSAEKMWNTERYQRKLENLAKVIVSADKELPTLIGLCEVENSSVLNDLINIEVLRKGNYAYIHFESPDERGIDCALLYNTEKFTPENSTALKVVLSEANGGSTRDILFVEGKLKVKSQKESVYLFINHWPSRLDGVELTAPRRAAAATVLRQITDSLNQKYEDPNIIIMGDFNDTPFDKSIQVTLGAFENSQSRSDECLVGLMSDFQKYNTGTYNFKGNWQCIDQFIISEGLYDKNRLDIKTFMIVREEFMLYHNEKYGDSPNKTYSAGKYHGGYSDHLPIYMQLIFL